MGTKAHDYDAPTPGKQTQENAEVHMLVGDTFRGTFTAIDSMKVKVSAGAHFGGMTLPRWLWIENEDGNVVWKEGKATTNPTETLDPTELAPGQLYTLCMNFTKAFNDASQGYSDDPSHDGSSIISLHYLKL